MSSLEGVLQGRMHLDASQNTQMHAKSCLIRENTNLNDCHRRSGNCFAIHLGCSTILELFGFNRYVVALHQNTIATVRLYAC